MSTRSKPGRKPKRKAQTLSIHEPPQRIVPPIPMVKHTVIQASQDRSQPPTVTDRLVPIDEYERHRVSKRMRVEDGDEGENEQRRQKKGGVNNQVCHVLYYQTRKLTRFLSRRRPSWNLSWQCLKSSRTLSLKASMFQGSIQCAIVALVYRDCSVVPNARILVSTARNAC